MGHVAGAFFITALIALWRRHPGVAFVCFAICLGIAAAGAA